MLNRKLNENTKQNCEHMGMRKVRECARKEQKLLLYPWTESARGVNRRECCDDKVRCVILVFFLCVWIGQETIICCDWNVKWCVWTLSWLWLWVGCVSFLLGFSLSIFFSSSLCCCGLLCGCRRYCCLFCFF